MLFWSWQLNSIVRDWTIFHMLSRLCVLISSGKGEWVSWIDIWTEFLNEFGPSYIWMTNYIKLFFVICLLLLLSPILEIEHASESSSKPVRSSSHKCKGEKMIIWSAWGKLLIKPDCSKMRIREVSIPDMPSHFTTSTLK